MNWKKQFEEGLLSKNPVLVQLLGMCSVLQSPQACLTASAWAFLLPSF